MDIFASNNEELTIAYQKSKPGELCPCNSGLLFKECHGWHSSNQRKKSGGSLHGGRPRPAVRNPVMKLASL
jgi:hypothetical protein